MQYIQIVPKRAALKYIIITKTLRQAHMQYFEIPSNSAYTITDLQQYEKYNKKSVLILYTNVLV